MWVYGKRSASKLVTCHRELQDVFDLYRKKDFYEITIIHGWRGEDIQHQAYIEGNSTKDWPNSKHNIITPQEEPCSDAVDYGPWTMLPSGKMGVPWKDTHAFAIVGGLLLACSKELGYNLRYGGDWDMDGQTTDQRLMD